MTKPQPAELLQGTLELLILRTLELGPLHGLGVSDRIKQITRGVFHVKAGSLFPALHRLEQNGALTGAWGPSENNRRARFYSLTRIGRVSTESATLVADINAIARAQVERTSVVVKTIEQISSIATSTQLGAETTVSTLVDLTALSERLSQSINRFKVAS